MGDDPSHRREDLGDIRTGPRLLRLDTVLRERAQVTDDRRHAIRAATDLADDRQRGALSSPVIVADRTSASSDSTARLT